MKPGSMICWSPEKPGIHRAKLLAHHKEQRRLPINLEAKDKVLFAHELVRTWGSCEAIALDGLTILGNTWLQLQWGRVADTYRATYFIGHDRCSRLKDLAKFRPLPKRIDQALWVHDEFSGNYFHWLTDVLTKLQVWRESGNSCRTLILPSHFLNRQFISDSLRILGFKSIAWSGEQLVVNRLFVISPTAPTGNFRADLLRRLRHSLMLEPWSGSSDESCVYISRSDAAKRFIENESDLSTILRQGLGYKGLRVVRLEGQSLMEQIKLFRSCKLLVGLHGAGLANMLWMPPGSDVIEIRRRGDNHNNCYFAMACALGHNYRYVQADDITQGQDIHSARLFLDPRQFERVIRETWSYNT